MSQPDIFEVFLLNELKLISNLNCLQLGNVNQAVVQTSLSLPSFKSTARLIKKIDYCQTQHNTIKNKPFFSNYDKISYAMIGFDHVRASNELEEELGDLLKELSKFGPTTLRKSQYLDDIINYGVPPLP